MGRIETVRRVEETLKMVRSGMRQVPR